MLGGAHGGDDQVPRTVEELDGGAGVLCWLGEEGGGEGEREGEGW